jgi:hypothetical protein
MAVHQQFKAGLDTKGYEAGMARIENATRSGASMATREFDKVQQSATRASGGKGSMRAGQVAMQMQDVAVQMQSGARASTIIAQQGSQILSVFGPQGMLLGGLVASAAMFWELVRGSKALTAEAKAQKAQKAQDRSTAAAQSGLDRKREDDMAVKVAEARATLSKEEADAVERRLGYEERIAAIRRDPNLSKENKGVFEDGVRARERAENRVRARERGAERVAGEGQGILNRADQIRGKAPSKAEVAREGREQRQAERRAIGEEVDALDRKERNSLQGTGRARTKGLNIGEREKAQSAREEAAKVAKDKKVQADKILNGIDNLISK